MQTVLNAMAKTKPKIKIRSVQMTYFVDLYTLGDSDVISVPAGFRRHLMGKTPINVFTVISLKCVSLAR